MAKILVVDDHLENRRLLATVLGSRGHVVIEAGDGVQGLAMVRDQRPDLVILHTSTSLQDQVKALAARSGVTCVLEESGDPHLIVSVVEDVLATDAPELALRQGERRFRSLTEALPVGVFSMTPDGTPTYSNARLEEICGIAVTGQGAPSWIDRVHPDDLAAVIPGTGEKGGSPAPYRRRVRIVGSGGEERWADVHAAPFLDDQGLATAYVGTVEDVTELVSAREQQEVLEARLRTSDRLESLGQLAGGIAHDLNNLLSLILNYAQFVTDGVVELIGSSSENPLLEEMLSDAGEIGTTARRAAELTHHLLVFARGEVVEPEIVDLNALVAGLEEPLSRTIGDRLTATTSLDPTVWKVKADPASLEQILMNLVLNARDAITETGTIAVSTENVVIDDQVAVTHALPPGRYVKLAVRDSGEGMAPDVAAHAFEPFFTTKPNGIGKGLGLSTVYGTVSQLGGTVLIYSEPGNGTIVRVYLPVADEPADVVVEDAATPQPGQGQSILLVEDEAGLRATAARILARNGYSVVAATGGEAAMAVVEDAGAGIDLVVTDLLTPGMSAHELAQRIARIRPALPVLFISGYPDGLRRLNGSLDASISLMEKPFTRASLLHAVAEALNR